MKCFNCGSPYSTNSTNGTCDHCGVILSNPPIRETPPTIRKAHRLQFIHVPINGKDVRIPMSAWTAANHHLPRTLCFRDYPNTQGDDFADAYPGAIKYFDRP